MLFKDEESGFGGSCIDGVICDDWGLFVWFYLFKLKFFCYVWFFNRVWESILYFESC